MTHLTIFFYFNDLIGIVKELLSLSLCVKIILIWIVNTLSGGKLMIIIASHGDYAKATLSSCEMIAGKISDVKAVAFHDPMGINDVVTKYQAIKDEKSTPAKDLIILTDISSGTPANAALLFQEKNPGVRVFSGLSLSLLLTLVTGTPVDEAITQNREMIKELGVKTTPSQPVKASLKAKPTSSTNKNDNPIISVRIDSRLIHGQVATMWLREVNASRVMVIDDEIVKSKVQKSVLKSAVPQDIHLSILTTKGAAQRIKANQYQGQRVFIIVRDPRTLLNLTKEGVKLQAINLGNLSMSAGARQIAKSVAVSPQQEAALKDLAQEKIKLYHQMVPNDQKEDVMALLAKGGK